MHHSEVVLARAHVSNVLIHLRLVRLRNDLDHATVKRISHTTLIVVELQRISYRRGVHKLIDQIRLIRVHVEIPVVEN